MACSDALKTFADHMQNPKPGTSSVLRFVLVTNWLGANVHYCEGSLTAWNPPVASGSGQRYSSYERWNFPAEIQLDAKKYPFDPNRKDPMTLSVNLNTGVVAGSFSFQAQCENGVLYGFSKPTGGLIVIPVMHVLALLSTAEQIVSPPA